MRTLIIIFFTYCNLYSQSITIETYNFSHDNQILTWQHVFKGNYDINTVNNYLKSINCISTKNEGIIDFEKEYTLNQLNPHGYIWGQFPTYINNGVVYGYIEFKNQKYRVTITSHKIQNTMNADTYDELQSWVFKNNNKMRYPKTNFKVLKTFNNYFIDTFTVKATDTNW